MPVARNPIRRVVDALRGGRLIRRALPNLLRDLRYGGYLGGSIPSRFRALGMHATESTDWWDLEQMFSHPDTVPRAGDVIVDVGCGKGRVLGYFARVTRGANRVVGIEIDPDIGARTQRRMRGLRSVEVVVGDAIELLPPDASLIYFANPFEEEIVRRFAEALEERSTRLADVRIVYFNSAYTGPFVERGWRSEPLRASMRAVLLRPPAA